MASLKVKSILPPWSRLPGGGITPAYNDLYGEVPPERDTFLTLHVHERVGISRDAVYERVEKSVI